VTPNGDPVVLIADDDKDILALVEFVLTRESYHVVTAPDGEVAVRLAAEHQPDLAILDVRMPKLDGYEVTKQIRRSEALSDLPVILLSASVEEMHIQRGYDAGASHYMDKPFSPRDLLERVSSALQEGSSASGTAA
jgi:DNA-binding response OmpR family regulator